MKSIKFLALASLAGAAAIASAQTDIARWNFNAVVAAPDNTPTASTVLTSAFLTQLGMTNTYNTGNTASCDVLQTGGDPNSLSTGYTWRVRGAQSPTGDNGWALAAPQYSQGAEIDVSTVGYSNVSFDFDWFTTNQGIQDLQVQYNLNVNNANGWTNYTGSYGGNQATVLGSPGILVATANGYNTTGTTAKFNMVDLSGVAGASNDANLGFRLVSCYDPTAQTYLGASGGTYNNSSGNWRFDQIAVQGTAAPELPTGVIFAVVGLGLVFVRSRRA